MDTKGTKEPVYSKDAGRCAKSLPRITRYSNSVLVWTMPFAVFLFNQFNSVYKIRSKVPVIHKQFYFMESYKRTFLLSMKNSSLCKQNHRPDCGVNLISLLRVAFNLIWYTELSLLKRNAASGIVQTKTLLLYLVIRGKLWHSDQIFGIDRFLCALCIHH